MNIKNKDLQLLVDINDILILAISNEAKKHELEAVQKELDALIQTLCKNKLTYNKKNYDRIKAKRQKNKNYCRGVKHG